MGSSYAQVESVSNLIATQVHDEHPVGRPVADLRNRANEGFQHLESRRRAGQAEASSTSARSHSQREGAMKTPRIRSSFSRATKNCLTRYGRNYSVRSACGSGGKWIRAVSLGTHRNWKRDPNKERDGMRIYDIMATKTGPHAVSTILPIAYGTV